MKKRGITDSFNYAITGLIHAIRTQRNMKIHVLTAIGVILASLSFGISKTETILLCLTITLVIAAELFNTAVESAVDATTNYYHPLVKVAKNTAAAAVLVTAINALLVGILIFWRPITTMTYTGITVVKQSSPYLVAAILGIICLVVLFIKAQVGEGTPLRGGMPSGHTAVAFGMATMISYVSGNPVIITLSFILAVIVAQSRVDSRVHTFWEVLVGAMIGLLTTVLIFRIFGY
jgi:diacylglycerol kinase (ATP)